MELANPKTQRLVCADTWKAYFADYPTLNELNAAFQRDLATQWLVVELFDLSEFCGCRGKLTPDQLEQLADIIVKHYGTLKVSELMLFCQRFKAGRYGRFYGNVDPMVITSALRVFQKERAEAWAEREQREADQRRQQSREGCITWDEYCQLRGISGRPSPLDRRDGTLAAPQ